MIYINSLEYLIPLNMDRKLIQMVIAGAMMFIAIILLIVMIVIIRQNSECMQGACGKPAIAATGAIGALLMFGGFLTFLKTVTESNNQNDAV